MQEYDPRYRPVVIWRWQRCPAPAESAWVIEQFRRQELGGVAVALPHSMLQEWRDNDTLPAVRSVIQHLAAEGAAHRLMVWVALPDPVLSHVDLTEPSDVGSWLEDLWAPLLTHEGRPWPGLSGIIAPAVCPPPPPARHPWPATFRAAFLDQKGYVPGLAQEAHPQVRFDLLDVQTTLIATAWYGALGDWCDNHQLNLMACTSHARQNHVSHPIEKYIPDVDVPAVALPFMESAPLLCKGGRSASVLSGRQRTAVFLEAGPLWAYNLRNLAEAVERLIVSGADFIVMDGFGETSQSAPGLSHEIPQWEELFHWSRRVGRLCALFAQGRETARVAILRPTTSLWALPEGGARSAAITSQFQRLCAELDDAQVQYVLVDEPALARVAAVGQQLFLRDLWLDALIIPPLTHVLAPTVAALKRVADQSRIFAFGAGDVEIIEVNRAFSSDPPRRVSLRGIEGILFTYGDTSKRSDVFWHAIPRSVRLTPGEAFRCRHVEGGGVRTCLAVNEGAPRSASARVDWSGRVYVRDPHGEALKPVETKTDGPALEFDMDFTDQSSLLLELRPDEDVPVPPRIWAVKDRVEVPGPWHFTPHGGNSLRITAWPAALDVTAPVVNCRVTLSDFGAKTVIYLDSAPLNREGEAATGQPRSVAIPGALGTGRHMINVEPAPEGSGLAWLVGDFAVDARVAPPAIIPIPDMEPGPWEECGFPYFSGRASYTAEVEVPESLAGAESILCLADVGSMVEMEVNGHVAALRPWAPYRARVTEYLRLGPNLITLTISNTLQNQFHGPDAAHPSGMLAAPYLEFGTWSRSE